MTITLASESANDIQHGGSHYKSEYEHWDMAADLGLDYFAAAATKYVTRHRRKNGREDCQKAYHYVAKKIELIEQNRWPAPHDVHVEIADAQQHLLIRFCEANGILCTSNVAEYRFLVRVALTRSTLSLNLALLDAEFMIAGYEDAPAEPVPPAAIPSNVAALMEKKLFNVEGWFGDMRVLWKCNRCKMYFHGREGLLPSQVHTACRVEPADEGEATPRYVNQG